MCQIVISARWLTSTRYIHIPLGGTNNQLVSTALIFTFVALWHDLTFRLLAWGWLVSIFIVPEVAARYILPSAKVSSLYGSLNKAANISCSTEIVHGIGMFVL